MVVKKVSFKHFENKNIKQQQVVALDGIYKYSRIYFRITFNRKTSAYNSTFFTTIINIFLYPNRSFMDWCYKVDELATHWDKFVKTIQDKDSKYIQILIENVIEKFGYFDFKYFNISYNQSHDNFLYGMDLKILKAITHKLEYIGLNSTKEILENFITSYIGQWTASYNMVHYTHRIVFELFKELKPKNSNSIIDKSTLQLIKVFNVLHDRFLFICPINENKFSYLPTAYLKFGSGRKKIVQILTEEFSDREIKDFMIIVDEILNEYYMQS